MSAHLWHTMVGGLNVDGLGTSYEHLKAAGRVFHCPPLECSESTWYTYGRDPGGHIIDLLEILAPDEATVLFR